MYWLLFVHVGECMFGIRVPASCRPIGDGVTSLPNRLTKLRLRVCAWLSRTRGPQAASRKHASSVLTAIVGVIKNFYFFLLVLM